MALPVLVEDQTQLPEGMEDYYQENGDGTYVLDVDGVESHPSIVGLKNSYQKEQKARQKYKSERDQLKSKADLIPDDVETETLQQVIERLQAGEDPFASNDKNKPDPAKIKAEIEKRYQNQLDELTQGLSKKDQQVRQLVIDSGLTSALAKHKVTNPVYQRAAKKLLADQIQVKEDEDGNVVATVETDMGEIGLDQYVQNWTAGEEGSAFVDGNTGSGAQGNRRPRGKKEMSRAQFDELSPAERAEFTRNGGRIYDT